MDTDGVMKVALDLAHMKEVPADSGVFVRGERIRKILFAIDAGPAEVALARSLGCDAVVAHHPLGRSAIDFPRVVRRHFEFMVEKRVPARAARAATEELVNRVALGRHASNYNQVVDSARLLRMPLMNIHLPIDQVTRDFLLARIRRSRAKKVGSLLNELAKLREFRLAATKITQVMGTGNADLGNWVLVFAAGTNGGYPVAKAYFENGVDTVIYLHIDQGELTKLKNDCRGNLVVLGHMAGDSIGANIFLEALRSKGVASETLGVIR
jgi:Duf34/NIF3 (NGG1p interacting factor 3)